MKFYLGIDLGSTTSKAVILDGQERIIGRGITNTRSDYAVAAKIAQSEAEYNSRFTMLHRSLKETTNNGFEWDRIFPKLESRFHYLQFLTRFDQLVDMISKNAAAIKDESLRDRIVSLLPSVTQRVKESISARFLSGEISATSEFFRDLFGATYIREIDNAGDGLFEQMVALYDRSITPIENREINFDFGELLTEAANMLPEEMADCKSELLKHLDNALAIDFEPTDYIGTGYGRQLLPFEEKHIKSEILCHAMGAHACFPKTRTVLDIGGQDTKAIQVDKHGMVTSFQMNDRCAAGCGRYLGYIADEMSISVGELGPIAMKATHEANICSTCTVFAGAELREYLNLGEKKENILAGLHRAIVQRAFALLARSGGVRDQFTFTGGVARNPAIVKYVGRMVSENYGELTINNHTDSIFMGALGGALFATRRI